MSVRLSVRRVQVKSEILRRRIISRLFDISPGLRERFNLIETGARKIIGSEHRPELRILTTKEDVMQLNKLCTLTVLSLLPLFSTVQAADMNDLEACVLVPRVIWEADDPDNVSTSVGLINRDSGAIFWGFYDVNGNKLVNGRIPVTGFLNIDTLTPFIWDPDFTLQASGLENQLGYLLFCLDENRDTFINNADSGELGGNAFYIDRRNADVAYIPTVAVSSDDLNSQTPDLSDRPIADISDGADPDDLVDIQYLVDGSFGGDETDIYFFTVTDPGTVLSVDFLDGAGGISLTAQTLAANQNLTALDPETISGPPTIAPSGFIGWRVPNSATRAFVFSIVDSPVFGAIQTLLGNKGN
jgi:hypothetical protein